MVTVIILIVLAVLVVAAVVIYNSLVTLNVRIKEAWSDINVQMKRRYDLIPNLINSVKGYASHEKGILEKVTETRAQAMNAQGVKEQAQAENQFQAALKSLFAVSENYPDLKANQNFLQLQEELVDTEDKIQAARRFYNGSVRDFNTRRTIFPVNLLAGLFGFREDKEFFELDEAETAAVNKPVEVKF